jgi:probable HAF family extracellular repeat protein
MTDGRAVGAGALALLMALGNGARPAAAETYTIIDLGTLGGAQSQAMGINAAGQVVGKADLVGARDAFLYDGAHMRDLGSLGYGLSTARGVNDLGQVVGESLLPDTLNE